MSKTNPISDKKKRAEIAPKGLRRLFREPKPGFAAKLAYSLRRRIMTGTLIMVPILIGFFPVFYLYPRLNALAAKILRIPVSEMRPGLGFALALFIVLSGLYIIGIFAETVAARWTIKLIEKILTQIPVVAWCYRTTKQVVDLVAVSHAKPFRKVVLVEFPRKDVFSVGFVTGEWNDPGQGGRRVHVFLPTTPHLTCGYVLLFRPEEILETGLTVDQGLRFVISGGIVDIGEAKLLPYRSEPPALAEPSAELQGMPTEA